MAGKLVDINIKFNAEISKLQALGREMDSLAKKQDSMDKTNSSLNNSTTAFGRTADHTTGKVNSLRTAFASAAQQTNMSGGFLRGLQNTTSQVMTLTKYITGLTAAVYAFGGMAVRKGVADLAEFNRQLTITGNIIAPGSPLGKSGLMGALSERTLQGALRSGTNPLTYAQGQVQFFSSGYNAPTADFAKDPALFAKQMGISQDMFEFYAKFAKSQGADPFETAKASGALLQNMGLDPSKMENARYAQEFLTGFNVTSQGRLSELMPQISKVFMNMKSSGAAPEELASLIGLFTQRMSPDMAGDVAMGITREMGMIPKKSTMYVHGVERAAKSMMGTGLSDEQLSKNIELIRAGKFGSVKGGADSQLTMQDLAILQPYLDVGTYGAFEIDPVTGKKKTFGQKIASFMQMRNAGGSDAVQSILENGMASNVRMQQLGQLEGLGLQTLDMGTSTIHSYTDAINALNDKLELGTITQAKYNEEAQKLAGDANVKEFYASFAEQWDEIQTKISVAYLKLGTAFAPALEAVNKVFMAGTMSAEKFNEIIDKGFGEAAAKVDAVVPGLGTFVKLLGDAIKWMNSDAGKKFFQELFIGIGQLASVLGQIIQLLAGVAAQLLPILQQLGPGGTLAAWIGGNTAIELGKGFITYKAIQGLAGGGAAVTGAGAAGMGVGAWLPPVAIAGALEAFTPINTHNEQNLFDAILEPLFGRRPTKGPLTEDEKIAAQLAAKKLGFSTGQSTTGGGSILGGGQISSYAHMDGGLLGGMTKKLMSNGGGLTDILSSSGPLGAALSGLMDINSEKIADAIQEALKSEPIKNAINLTVQNPIYLQDTLIDYSGVDLNTTASGSTVSTSPNDVFMNAKAVFGSIGKALSPLSKLFG